MFLPLDYFEIVGGEKASIKDDFSTAVLCSCIVVILCNWLKSL